MKRFMPFGTLLLAVTFSSVVQASLLDSLVPGKKSADDASQQLSFTGIDEKKRKLQLLEERRTELTDSEKAFLTATTANIDEVTSQIALVKELLLAKSDDSFLTKKLALLNDRLHALKELKRSREKLIGEIDLHIKLLRDYLADPNLNHYRQELKISGQVSLSFEVLQNINQMILDQQKIIVQLHEQEKNANIELENRKHTAAATSDDYKKNKEGRQAVGASENLSETFDLDARQRAELSTLEEQLYIDKKERDALLLKEIEYKKGLLKTELFIARMQLDVLREIFRSIKPMIKVSEADVAYAKDELAKKKQLSFETRDQIRKDSELTDADLKEKKLKLEEISRRYSIPLGVDLDEWTREPIKTIAGYQSMLEVAELNDHVLLLERKKDLFEAEIALEDEKIEHESVHILVKSSFYKIIARKFFADDQITQEKKKYDAPRAQAKANISLIKERRSSAQHLLDQQKKALENIQERRKKLQELRTTLFRGYPAEHTTCLDLINSAEEKVKTQFGLLAKVISIDADISSMLKKTIKQIEFIRSELEAISIWYRPEHAISWSGVLAVVPNLMSYFSNMFNYFTHLDASALAERAHQAVYYPFSIFITLIVWLFILVVVVLARRILPYSITRLKQVNPEQNWAYMLTLFSTMLLGFLTSYYWSVVAWWTVFLALRVYHVTDPYVNSVFYLISIPYLLYLAHRFIEYACEFNSAHGYIFIKNEFQRRFFRAVSIILYASIVVIFFRKAFVLGTYAKSELPTIMLAIYFVIVQIALVCLVAKEQILHVVPTRYEIGEWLYTQVDRYYYLVLMLVIAIIVLSNPYVGFGKLVLYILSRLLYTALLLPVLFWIHSLIKEGASPVFFSTQEGVLRERFDYGKTLYGLFVISLFVTFIFVGGLTLAKIWGWPDRFAQMNQWADIMDWLKTPVILEKTDNPISMFSMLKILSFVVIGFVVSYILNRFVLGRIFDVLLIEPGVQNTIASLTRYLVVLATIILGFQAVGLGALVWYLITALGIGIGWVLKDPIADFIAYFIILVQRPIKIGDYITMDDETKGVVRKITPRSVVIRRKNSTTLIVPNAMMIKRPIANWNYSRGFTAFDDIMVTITYQSDPTAVKALLEKVLDANTFVLKSPKPIVRLENFNEFGFVFLVRGFLSSNYTLDQWDIASEVRLEIVKLLRQNSIQLAVPVRIVMSKDSAQQGYPGVAEEELRS